MHDLSVTQGLVDAVLDPAGEGPVTADQRCARPVFRRIVRRPGLLFCRFGRLRRFDRLRIKQAALILACDCGRADIEVLSRRGAGRISLEVP